MTVSYSRLVATVSYGTFVRLLFIWKGSVYKLIWPGLLMYCSVYFSLAILYQMVPSSTPEYRAFKRIFLQFCAYAAYLVQAIPISFVLGFYVQLVLSRWWKQFANLPTPDSICLLLASYLRNSPNSKHLEVTKEKEDRPLIFRRTISRYISLSTALCLSSFSLSMKLRFPFLETLVACGLMTQQELVIYSGMGEATNGFYVPLVWAITLATKAKYESMITYDRQLDDIIRSIVEYWERLFQLLLHDWINVPLVYNQVVALAVYAYFFMTIFAHQFVDLKVTLKDANVEGQFINSILSNFTLANISSYSNFTHWNPPPPPHINMAAIFDNYTDDSTSSLADILYSTPSALDVYPNIPVFSILSFIFYNGWLKVAEINLFPFGTDDNDFDVVPLLERNLNTSMHFVDTMVNNANMLPELLRQADSKATNELTIPQVRKNALEVSHEPALTDLSCDPKSKRKASNVFSGSMSLIYNENLKSEINQDCVDVPVQSIPE